MTSPAASAPLEHDPAVLRAAVILLALAGFFSGAALRICDGLLPRLASDFGITPGVAGDVVLTFSVAYGFSQLVFGPLGDRYGKARMMCAAMFGAAAASLICALAPGFESLVRLRVLWGISAAGVIPLSIAWAGDTIPFAQRQGTLARLMLGNLTGMTAGQLAGGVFADLAIGWRGAFVSLSIGYVVIALLLLARLRTIPQAPPVRGRSLFAIPAQLADVLRIRWARLVLLSVLAEGLFMFGPLAFLPTYLHQHFQVSLSAATTMLAFFAVGGVVYAISARHIVERFGELRMVTVGGAMMGIAFVALYLMPFAWLAAPVAFLTGFGTYLVHNTLQTHGSQMAPKMRGTAMALFAFCFFLGQAGGVSAAGWAYDHVGPSLLLLVPAVVLPLNAWNFARGLNRRGQA